MDGMNLYSAGNLCHLGLKSHFLHINYTAKGGNPRMNKNLESDKDAVQFKVKQRLLGEGGTRSVHTCDAPHLYLQLLDQFPPSPYVPRNVKTFS